MDEQLAEALAAAAKQAKEAKKATRWALIAVALAIVVLAIDNSIKRAVVEKAEEARQLLAEFERRVHGTETAGESGTVDGAAVNGDHGSPDVVLDGQSSGTGTGPDEGASRPAPARRKAGTTRRAQGDG